jgi:hypothetical protein
MAERKQSQTLQDQLNLLFSQELFGETERRLVFGSVFLIPNDISRIPSRKRRKGRTRDHPFVVIKYFRETNNIVLCALRTTDLSRKGLITPENVLPGLDKPGVIVLDEQFKIDAQKFVEFNCLGILPEMYIDDLKKMIVEKGWL